MDSFEFNKIAMAILGTIFAVFGINILSESIFHTGAPEKPGYAIAAVEASGGGKETAETGGAAVLEPVSALLASADPAAGEAVAKKCVSCHTFVKDGAKKVGPALYGVVERDVATHAGFAYSTGLKEFASGKKWTYEDLNGFLSSPKKYVKGTAMAFAGLKSVQDRANIISYLRTLSDNPAPLPAN